MGYIRFVLMELKRKVHSRADYLIRKRRSPIPWDSVPLILDQGRHRQLGIGGEKKSIIVGGMSEALADLITRTQLEGCREGGACEASRGGSETSRGRKDSLDNVTQRLLTTYLL